VETRSELERRRQPPTRTTGTAFDRTLERVNRDRGVPARAAEAVADSAENAPAPTLPVALDMLGTVVDYLRTTKLEPAERVALGQGTTVRRGRGYTLRGSAVPGYDDGRS